MAEFGVDEAHRAIGNFAYVTIVKYLKDKVPVRLIGLSATPGNNIGKIQDVINNLCISKFEAKDEDDEDVKPYVYSKCIREVTVSESSGVTELDDLLKQLIKHASGFFSQNEELSPEVKVLIQKISKLAIEDTTAMYQKLVGYQETFIKRLPESIHPPLVVNNFEPSIL